MNIYKDKQQTLECYIETLTPVHSGCDEYYEPTNFTLDQSRQQLTVFDPIIFISNLSKEEQNLFSNICLKGTVFSIIEIYKFLKNKKSDGKKIDVCKDFIKHYNNVLSISSKNGKNIQNNLNRFLIPRTAFSPVDQRPYIPGSSIKGAIRTACLNMLQKQKNLKQKVQKGGELEKKLMDFDNIKKIEEDPFRLVKVSDFMPVGDVKTKIIYGVNEKKKQSDKLAKGVPIILETIQTGSLFKGTITAQKPDKGSGIKLFIDIASILASLDYFYLKEKEREDREMGVIGISPSFDWDQNGSLIRCGRHSGAESVTIENHRSINIMGKKGERPRYADKATTLWLASSSRRPNVKQNLKPFGWMKLNKISSNVHKQLVEKEHLYQKQLFEIKLAQQEELSKKQELIKQAKQAEQQQKIEEEKIRLEHLEQEKRKKSMSPEEREIDDLKDPDVIEEKINIAFKKLDQYSEDNKKIAATIIKQYWINNNKWEKKDLKKQWKKSREKIDKIKFILGQG